MIRPFADRTCVVVASGPSAADAPLNTAIGRAKIIAVNSSWRLAPFADVLFAGDPDWWIENNGCPAFAGMKVTTAHNVPFPDVRRVDMPVPRCADSGSQALTLAVSWGARRVLMVGFDVTAARGVHWHPPHAGLNPTEHLLERWRRELDAAEWPEGVTLINCSPASALERYQKKGFTEALLAGFAD